MGNCVSKEELEAAIAKGIAAAERKKEMDKWWDQQEAERRYFANKKSDYGSVRGNLFSRNNREPKSGYE